MTVLLDADAGPVEFRDAAWIEATYPGIVVPAWFTIPVWHETYGPEVGELCVEIGYPPDPEQQLFLDLTFAVGASWLPIAFQLAVIAARQNLKTGAIKMCEIGWLFVTDVPLSVHSAHRGDTCALAYSDIEQLIAGSPMLSKRVVRTSAESGAESIETVTGAALIWKNRTREPGRGLTGDRTVLDEGLLVTPGAVGAIMPTMSARPGSQLLWGSSAGKAESAALRGVRDLGRTGRAVRMGYLEWQSREHGCALPGCDHAIGRPGCLLDDRDAIRAANPQAGKRITWGYLADERRAMSANADMLAELVRERHGWWDKPAAEKTAIGVPLWESLQRADAGVGRVDAYAIAVDPDRQWGALVAAGSVCSCVTPFAACDLDADQRFVEVVEHQPGTGWIVDHAFAVSGGVVPVVVDGGTSSPAAPLIPALESAGCLVVVAGTSDVAASYALFMDGLAARSIWHGPQPELDEAVKVAKTRPCGDGGSAFGRNASDREITTIEAAGLAHWRSRTDPMVDILSTVW